MSSYQNERTIWEGGGYSKTNKGEQAGREEGQNSGIFSERTFWISTNWFNDHVLNSIFDNLTEVNAL